MRGICMVGPNLAQAQQDAPAGSCRCKSRRNREREGGETEGEMCTVRGVVAVVLQSDPESEYDPES